MNSDSKRKVRQVLEKQINKSFQNTLYQKVKKTAEISEIDINKVRETNKPTWKKKLKEKSIYCKLLKKEQKKNQ